MIEGSGSIHLISGSGSGSRRPKNKLIRRIRISNIVFTCYRSPLSHTPIVWLSLHSCWWASIPDGEEVWSVWPQEGEQRVHPGGWGPRLDLHWQVSHPPLFLKLQPLENYTKIVIFTESIFMNFTELRRLVIKRKETTVSIFRYPTIWPVVWIRNYFFLIRKPEFWIRIKKGQLITDPAGSGSFRAILWPLKKCVR